MRAHAADGPQEPWGAAPGQPAINVWIRRTPGGFRDPAAEVAWAPTSVRRSQPIAIPGAPVISPHAGLQRPRAGSLDVDAWRSHPMPAAAAAVCASGCRLSMSIAPDEALAPGSSIEVDLRAEQGWRHRLDRVSWARGLAFELAPTAQRGLTVLGVGVACDGWREHLAEASMFARQGDVYAWTQVQADGTADLPLVRLCIATRSGASLRVRAAERPGARWRLEAH